MAVTILKPHEYGQPDVKVGNGHSNPKPTSSSNGKSSSNASVQATEALRKQYGK